MVASMQTLGKVDIQDRQQGIRVEGMCMDKGDTRGQLSPHIPRDPHIVDMEVHLVLADQH